MIISGSAAVDVRDACRRVVDILDGRPRTRLHLTEPSIVGGRDVFPQRHLCPGPGT